MNHPEEADHEGKDLVSAFAGILPSAVNIRNMPGLAVGQRVVWSLDWVFSREYMEECPRALLVVEILIVLRTMVIRKVN